MRENLHKLGLIERDGDYFGKLEATQVEALNEVHKKEHLSLHQVEEKRYTVLRVCKGCETPKESVHYRKGRKICKSCVNLYHARKKK